MFNCAATSTADSSLIVFFQKACQVRVSHSDLTSSSTRCGIARFRATSLIDCSNGSGTFSTRDRKSVPPTGKGFFSSRLKLSRIRLRVIVANHERKLPCGFSRSNRAIPRATDANTSCTTSAASCPDKPACRHHRYTIGLKTSTRRCQASGCIRCTRKSSDVESDGSSSPIRPGVFGSFISTSYPQTGNRLVITKNSGTSGSIDWVKYWTKSNDNFNQDKSKLSPSHRKRLAGNHDSGTAGAMVDAQRFSAGCRTQVYVSNRSGAWFRWNCSLRSIGIAGADAAQVLMEGRTYRHGRHIPTGGSGWQNQTQHATNGFCWTQRMAGGSNAETRFPQDVPKVIARGSPTKGWRSAERSPQESVECRGSSKRAFEFIFRILPKREQ